MINSADAGYVENSGTSTGVNTALSNKQRQIQQDMSKLTDRIYGGHKKLIDFLYGIMGC
jgi:hypothetical protein